jgi:hypothetical protein
VGNVLYQHRNNGVVFGQLGRFGTQLALTNSRLECCIPLSDCRPISIQSLLCHSRVPRVPACRSLLVSAARWRPDEENRSPEGSGLPFDVSSVRTAGVANHWRLSAEDLCRSFAQQLTAPAVNPRTGAWRTLFIGLLLLAALLAKFRSWVGESPNWPVTLLTGVIFGLLILYVVHAFWGRG